MLDECYAIIDTQTDMLSGLKLAAKSGGQT